MTKALRYTPLPFMFLLLLFGLLIAFTTPVLAIDNPDTFEVNGVWVYQNVLEDDDQLYVIDYTIAYAVEPTEKADEAFFIRLMDDGTELATVYPYPYENDGYVRGVVSIYFTAASAPVWESNYSVEIRGNPFMSWSGDTPYVSVGTFNLWQDTEMDTTRNILASRILWLAQELTADWDASYDLFSTYSVGVFLSDYGVEYFSYVIENLSTIAPNCLADRTIVPELQDKDYTQDYSDDLVDDITDTPLDLTDIGSAWGLSRGQATGIFYYIIVFVFLIVLTRRLQSYKPLVLVSIPLVILGSFIGVPLVITILAAFLALLLIAYTLFYSPSNA